MVHRIFVVPGAPHVSGPVVRQQWTDGHGELFTRTPGLAGYVQNRPLAEEWDRLGSLVCAETWFADLDTERAAYASDYYREVVAADEARFLDRADVWSARIDDAPAWPDDHPRYRVLVLGAGPLTLSREAPGGGPRLDAIWFADRGAALAASSSAACFAVATEPVAYPVHGR